MATHHYIAVIMFNRINTKMKPEKNDILNEHNTRTERNAMGNIEEEN